MAKTFTELNFADLRACMRVSVTMYAIEGEEPVEHEGSILGFENDPSALVLVKEDGSGERLVLEFSHIVNVRQVVEDTDEVDEEAHSGLFASIGAWWSGLMARRRAKKAAAAAAAGSEEPEVVPVPSPFQARMNAWRESAGNAGRKFGGWAKKNWTKIILIILIILALLMSAYIAWVYYKDSQANKSVFDKVVQVQEVTPAPKSTTVPAPQPQAPKATAVAPVPSVPAATATMVVDVDKAVKVCQRDFVGYLTDQECEDAVRRQARKGQVVK